MRVIGPSSAASRRAPITQRSGLPSQPARVAIFLFFAAVCLTAADKRSRGQGKTDETPFAALAHLSAWLSEGNASGAIDAFDPQMKGYGEIQGGIDALTAQA